ncbi:MAG: FHA domain-containing protein, partial [Holophagales bacterium]|nr:FHA domain-containing protein [Holophagales bacterium]
MPSIRGPPEMTGSDTAGASRPPAAEAGRFRLRGRVGPRERAWTLASGLNRLGSSASNDLVIDHEGVSRQHAIVLVERAGAEVIDQESKNGTFVNGERVGRAALCHGSVLGLGSVELTLEVVAADDARMAFELTPVASIDSAASGYQSTASLEGGGTLPESWLALVGSCLESLREPGWGGGRALGILRDGLGADGAHLCSRTSGGLELLATSGEPDPAALEAYLFPLFRRLEPG